MAFLSGNSFKVSRTLKMTMQRFQLVKSETRSIQRQVDVTRSRIPSCHLSRNGSKFRVIYRCLYNKLVYVNLLRCCDAR